MVDVSPTAGMVIGCATELNPHRLFVETCQANGYHPSVVRGPRRDAAIVRVRRMVARVLRDAGCSLPEIGRIMARHHTSVLNLLDPYTKHQRYLGHRRGA